MRWHIHNISNPNPFSPFRGSWSILIHSRLARHFELQFRVKITVVIGCRSVGHRPAGVTASGRTLVALSEFVMTISGADICLVKLTGSAIWKHSVLKLEGDINLTNMTYVYICWNRWRLSVISFVLIQPWGLVLGAALQLFTFCA